MWNFPALFSTQTPEREAQTPARGSGRGPGRARAARER